MVWLLNSKNLQKCRVILPQDTSYLHKWLVRFLTCLLLPCLFFVCEIPKCVQLKNNILSPLMGWPTWIGILWKRDRMVTELAGGCECRSARFHAIKKFSWKWNLSFFKAVPRNKLPFYLGSRLHIISSTLSHFCLLQNAI